MAPGARLSARLSSWLTRAWLQRGTAARALRPLSLLYAAALRRERRLHPIEPGRLGHTPVVVVGNLVAGGAGKTPTVLALVRALQARGYAPGIVSRGYGRRGALLREVLPTDTAADVGDEPLLLRIRAGVPVVVGRDRRAAALQLLALHPGIDVVVSDDGLQHAGLPRSAQLIVFDERGAGNGWLLPAGPLREAMPSFTQAPCLHGVPSWVVYNADTATTPLPGTLAQRGLADPVLLADWWAGRRAGAVGWSALRGRPLLAAAGTARPGRFFAMLAAQGLDVVPLPLPDHHAYAELPWPGDTPDVVVTEKDAVKLEPARPGATRVWVAPLDFALDPTLIDALCAALAPPSPLATRPPDGHPPA